MWQAEADTELTLSASPTTAVGQKALFHGRTNLTPGKRMFYSKIGKVTRTTNFSHGEDMFYLP